MRYTITNNTDHALSLYPERNTASRALAVRLGIGKSASGEPYTDGWLLTSVGSVTGWIKIGAGVALADNGAVTPPPVEPPPPAIPNLDVVVHIGQLNITSVDITGDEIQPFVILLNGRVIWP